MGLGPVHAVSLAHAREMARDARRSLIDGIDPLQARRDALENNIARKSHEMTFAQCVMEYIHEHRHACRSEKHKKQWLSSLRTYVLPHIGKTGISRIDTAAVLKVLKPLWTVKTETASRIRGRIERVLSWAATLGFREGDNPARWRGHLEELLPEPSKIKKIQHHPAMLYRQVGEFYRLLEAQKGIAPKALRLVILAACRTSEALEAKWAEIDLAQGIWTIPGERMKNGREHRIPLSDEVLRLLQSLAGLSPDWVFPSAKRVGRPLSGAALRAVLCRMGCADVTVHGFRSSFRVWAAERTDCPREIAELALAHTPGTAVEKAYQRSDLAERRRALMRDWASWCKGNLSSCP
jgi:integrase